MNRRWHRVAITLLRSGLLAGVIWGGGALETEGQLRVDFNSTTQDGGPHPQTGFASYDAGHEVVEDFIPQYFAAFGTTVGLTPAWPNTTDNRVRQMIDRGSGYDGNWAGDGPDLVTDWLGIDSRTGNGGNGDWDRSGGTTPTYLTLTVSGIPAGTFEWTSYHHDTEYVWSDFQVEVSTDGGATYGAPVDVEMTSSSAGGNPPAPANYTGSPDPDPRNLPSTFVTPFASDGTSDIVFRFAPFADGVDPIQVHKQLFAINGLEIMGPLSTNAPIQLSLSSSAVGDSAPIGSLVGTLTTTDPTPGDTFTYSLVSGFGSDDNGQFAIDGDRLETDRDLSGLSGPLSIRVRTTDVGGEWFEKVFFITLIDDTDGDGLADAWELTYFPDLATATGAGNNDGDTLTNLEEQARGTNPILADTDGDTLNDDLEDDSRIYHGPGDPGSSPLLADTDGDGIDDADEISSANGYVTNPNQQDTDADGFPDPLELDEGTDPTDNTDFPDGLLPLRLNELLARNDTSIPDGFGNYEDWIEIYNPNSHAVTLDGYYLTDDAQQPAKWNFPAVSIPANGYLVVIASGKDLIDPGNFPHSNFQVASDGEYLAIVRPDGLTVDDAFSPAFPEQFTDIAYGRHPSTGVLQFYATPTPGTANGTGGYPGVVKDTHFSIDRGFYATGFPLALTSDTPGATIRYTLDGSDPSAPNGTIFDAANPIQITGTTTVRAKADLAGWLSSNADTHTYIFVDDVAQQPANPPGWPTDWANSGDPNAVHPADYEMDPRVVNNANGLGVYSVQEALLDIPTVSIAMEPSDFLTSDAEPATGIYSYPNSRWERVCSVEYILPDGTPGFQEDCKIEVHGNASRRPARMHKHSLRLTFTSEVGTPKLHYPLFPDSPVDEFNKLVLRACFTDSWGLVTWGGSNRYRPNDSQYIRDVWMKESLRDMGQPSSHGNFVHLYVNGLYFGLHNLTERLEDDFFADHLGGTKEDWLINVDLAAPPSRWGQMMGILNGNIADNAVYESAKAYLDMENFADYMLLHFYADSEDWPHHNGYAAANPTSGDGKFRFFCWDQEIVLDKFSWNRYDSGSGAGEPFQRVRLNPEFRMLFADRVQRHLFNGGALSEDASIARYLALANQIDKAIVAESARWGDIQETIPYAYIPSSSTDIDDDWYPPLINDPIYFTREQHWVLERDNVVGHYIPTLHDPADARATVNELRAVGLFPGIDAPVFSQHGGEVSAGFGLTLAAGGGEIYYTLDGTDPRRVGGDTDPSALLYDGSPLYFADNPTRVLARVWNGSEWSALSEAVFLVDTEVARSHNLAVSEIHYNPDGPDDTEFLELLNIGAVRLDLTDVTLAGAVNMTLGQAQLDPGERLVVVEDPIAFSNLYQDANSPYFYPGIRVAGSWQGGLANDADDIRVLDRDGGEIQTIPYRDGGAWPGRADGRGFSLERRFPNVPADRSDHWAASSLVHGSPGRPGDGPAVVINELLSHSDTALDWVELRNVGSSTVDIGGWYLSDELATPLKFQIPGDALLAPGEFAVFHESAFNTGTNAFAFSELGEEVVLSESSGTHLIRVVAFKDFGAAAPDVTFGRHLRSDQRDVFTALQTATPGTDNDVPRREAVGIGDIMFHPADGLPEYIELINTSDTTALLYDPGYPSNTWRLTSAADLALPLGVSIPGCGRILITATNPAAFRAAYSVPAEIDVYGPWSGKLDNDQESIRLRKPGRPETDGTVPYILVEKVDYRDYAPWPVLADGSGSAMQRLSYASYANDPATWYASSTGVATPGQGADPCTATPNEYPVLNLPGTRSAQEGAEFMLQLEATDPDLDQELVFQLEPGAPDGASLTTAGLFRWTPGEADGPGTFAVPVRVTDNGVPNLSHVGSLSLEVLELNQPPALHPGQIGTETNSLTLIPVRATWRYLDDGSDPGISWRDVAFDDSGWSMGPGPLGYGDSHIATPVSYGPNASAKYTTTYFRTTFTFAEPGAATELNLGLLRDDGAVIYLNGVEGPRDNMPTSGPILPTTPAEDGVGGAGETAYYPHLLDPAALRTGTNVVAVEVHQHSGTSSDLGFDLYLTSREVRAVAQGIADRTVPAGEEIRFIAEASDPDLPLQQIQFALGPGAPAAAGIDPLTGEFTWTPAETDGPAQVPITVMAIDDGQPALADTLVFTVTVIAPFQVAQNPEIPGQLAWPAIPGDVYRVEYADHLTPTEWYLLDEFTATQPDIVIQDSAAGQHPHRFYRVIWQR